MINIDDSCEEMKLNENMKENAMKTRDGNGVPKSYNGEE